LGVRLPGQVRRLLFLVRSPFLDVEQLPNTAADSAETGFRRRIRLDIECVRVVLAEDDVLDVRDGRDGSQRPLLGVLEEVVGDERLGVVLVAGPEVSVFGGAVHERGTQSAQVFFGGGGGHEIAFHARVAPLEGLQRAAHRCPCDNNHTLQKPIVSRYLSSTSYRAQQ